MILNLQSFISLQQHDLHFTKENTGSERLIHFSFITQLVSDGCILPLYEDTLQRIFILSMQIPVVSHGWWPLLRNLLQLRSMEKKKKSMDWVASEDTKMLEICPLCSGSPQPDKEQILISHNARQTLKSCKQKLGRSSQTSRLLDFKCKPT